MRPRLKRFTGKSDEALQEQLRELRARLAAVAGEMSAEEAEERVRSCVAAARGRLRVEADVLVGDGFPLSLDRARALEIAGYSALCQPGAARPLVEAASRGRRSAAAVATELKTTEEQVAEVEAELARREVERRRSALQAELASLGAGES